MFCGADPFKRTAYFPLSSLRRNIDISLVVYHSRLLTPELISPENRSPGGRKAARYRLENERQGKKKGEKAKRFLIRERAVRDRQTVKFFLSPASSNRKVERRGRYGRKGFARWGRHSATIRSEGGRVNRWAERMRRVLRYWILSFAE